MTAAEQLQGVGGWSEQAGAQAWRGSRTAWRPGASRCCSLITRRQALSMSAAHAQFTKQLPTATAAHPVQRSNRARHACTL